MQAELIVDARNAVGESPVWVARGTRAVLGGHSRRRPATLERRQRPCRKPGKPRNARLHRPPQRRQLGGRDGKRLLSSAPAHDGSLDSKPLASVDHARSRHALQRWPLRPPGPFLGRQHGAEHGRQCRRRRPLPLQRRPDASHSTHNLAALSCPTAWRSAPTAAPCTCPTRTPGAADLGLRLRHRQRHALQSPRCSST